MQYSQRLPNDPYPEPNPISRMDIYLFKIYSNSVLPSAHNHPIGLFPLGSHVKISKALLPSSILLYTLPILIIYI